MKETFLMAKDKAMGCNFCKKTMKFIKVTFKMIRGMDKEFFKSMVRLSTKVSGKLINLRVMEPIIMIMGIFFKETGKMAYRQVKEFTILSPGSIIKGNGIKENK